jgi:SdrD B-like protein
MEATPVVRTGWRPLVNVTVTMALTVGMLSALPMHAVQAAPQAVTLRVQSARTEPDAPGGPVTAGDPITAYRFIINEDNTGSTEQRETSPDCTPENPDYAMGDANPCAWTSVAGLASSSPIVTQGDETILNDATSLTLPDGRYLISVLADGYKLDGLHFSIPRANPLLTVDLQPDPLPTATVQALVFGDTSLADGQIDANEDGLAGFGGHIADTLGEVSTDVFGNPICTEYEVDAFGNKILDADGAPIPVPNTGGQCLSDANGLLTIPNLGTNRYALTVTPPNGQNWIQTTTLEGNHDWDAWVMEGATGLDTEFTVAGEPLPNIIFGFVPGPTPGPGYHPPAAGVPAYWRDPTLPAGTGQIKGVVDAVKIYVPFTGGISWPMGNTGGVGGTKIDKPIRKPWIVLNDLQRGDVAVWIGQGDVDGKFTIPNLPAGNYTITYWDEPQDYLLDLFNVTVGPGPGGQGETVDLGAIPLAGWWATYDGYVFKDLNRNGVRDAGEQGVPNYSLTLRRRDNSLMDRGSTSVSTDQSGYYRFESAYPLTQWIVMEAYNDLYYTTGVTWQADNQPEPTTVLGAGVDVSVLPIIGLAGRMDWGVHAYDATGTNGVDPQNGGIVGTVSYDTTRNELDPAFAAVEDWQPGVSNLPVNLYSPVDCGTNAGAPCDADGDYELNPDGSFKLGQHLNSYLTETWEHPTGCKARNVDGEELLYPHDQQVLPKDPSNPGRQNPAADCIEAPLMGTQFQTGFSSVDGNYGFGDGCFTSGFGSFDADGATMCADPDEVPAALPAGDYLVKVGIPDDAFGRPLYHFTREEDINIGNGDAWIPQAPPPACAGALHTVDVFDAPTGSDGYGEVVGDGGVTNDVPVGVTVPASTPTENSTFANDVGGSPYEGQQKPLCDTKLVPLKNGRSIVPTFNVFTDVPLPGRFFGYMVDDLNFSADPTSVLYGEKAGVPFAPVGIYDYTNRLVTTVETDFNGLYDVLLPSTNRINCPTPSGVCPNVYRFVGNDPGNPIQGRLNPNYNPQFRTIAAEFESIPGVVVPADNAPTQVGVTVQLPGGQFNQFLTCPLNDPAGPTTTPEIFTVSKPYVNLGDGDTSNDTFAIRGQGFGSAGTVTLDGSVVLPTGPWSETQISGVTVPPSTAGGVHQLAIKRADNGNGTVNGLTFHVLTGLTVGPYPSNGVIDNFNRTDNTSGFGSGWTDDAPSSVFNVISNQARVRTGAGNVYNAWRSGGSAFNTNQEAFFTFAQVSGQAGANEQGLLLKFDGSTPGSNGASWIEIALNNTPANTLRIRTKSSGSGTITTRATFTSVTFAAGDQLGARALSDGTIIVYKNGTEIGRTTFAASGTWTGRIGVRFEGTGTTTATEARFDNFGGGNISGVIQPYAPNVYEVGPGHTYDPGPFILGTPPHAIQNAIDAAAASAGPDLVVVYPGTPQGDRINPFGAYYENLILDTPIKLQGVGPGGVYPDGSFVTGSVIDGSANGGDTALATQWRTRLGDMTWVGNQEVYEGQIIYLLAESTSQYDGQYQGQTYRAAIDGFDLRGGDQMGFPSNINEIGGGPTGLPPNAVTQGGAIFANDYVQNLQITNNVVRNNGGSYGTIRLGTPDLPDNQTDDVRIANNRIVASGGTNLAGAIGIFAGAERYEVARNDICGNFSAEYGGGLSVYGFSPNGSIHHNRIYYNRSYDEGAGIMVAGALPADPADLSPGSGSVDIYNNLIQGNLADDDGGGLRFLMASSDCLSGSGYRPCPINVYNNMIVNNVSTHEGGGVSLNDAPNVRLYNNTIMKNITTATAVDSNGLPMPAGLSTSANSAMLQAVLPGGSPTFSNPVQFNNIFWDNRAGMQSGGTVVGIGGAGDATPVDHWDMGAGDGSGSLTPTNSIIQTPPDSPSPTTGYSNPAGSGNQVGVDPLVVTPFDTTLAFAPWRESVNFVGAIMVAQDLPPTLFTGDYHIPTGSPAVNGGAPSKVAPILPSPVVVPTTDYDGQSRPSPCGATGSATACDIGADELVSGPPVSAFPRTVVLDNFNRANGALGGIWAGDVATTATFDIVSGAPAGNVRVRGTGNAWWNSTAKFGGNQEAFFTFTQVSPAGTEQGLLLKFSGSNPNGSAATWIEVAYNGAGGAVVKTKSSGAIVQRGGVIAATFASGDQLGARTLTDGSVLIYKNGVQIGSRNVTSGVNPWPSALATGRGRIGVRFVGTTAGAPARFDDFGGGTMP